MAKTKLTKLTKLTKADKFIALTGLDNDKTGRRYEAGDEITVEDFSEDVILHWLEKQPPVLRPKDG